MAPILIPISGLPRSGKTSLADGLASFGITHIPLDRYIRTMPSGTSFLEWIASPESIDWSLFGRHLNELNIGRQIVAPADWGPTWGEGGQRMTSGGSGRVRLMKPSDVGYSVPGCYAFDLPSQERKVLRVFVAAPRRTIAERALGGPVPDEDVESVLDDQLSSNWREIENYVESADMVISGLEQAGAQVQTVISAVDRALRS